MFPARLGFVSGLGFPESGEVARRGKAAATEGLFTLVTLEFYSCFQPLSHPRLARLTAPLDNGSQGLRSRLECFHKSIFANVLG